MRYFRSKDPTLTTLCHLRVSPVLRRGLRSTIMSKGKRREKESDSVCSSSLKGPFPSLVLVTLPSCISLGGIQDRISCRDEWVSLTQVCRPETQSTEGQKTNFSPTILVRFTELFNLSWCMHPRKFVGLRLNNNLCYCGTYSLTDRTSYSYSQRGLNCIK